MRIENTEVDLSFINEVERISGQKMAECYQCGKCSAGCPIGYVMELLPDKVMRFVQLGMKEDVLKSDTPWLCASCETCATRCPQEVELPRVMEAVRSIAIREGRQAAGKGVPLFYSAFLNNIHAYGRIFEPAMVARFNFAVRQPFKDMKNAFVLFGKRKISFRPHTPKGMAEIRKMFERIKAEEP